MCAKKCIHSYNLEAVMHSRVCLWELWYRPDQFPVQNYRKMPNAGINVVMFSVVCVH